MDNPNHPILPRTRILENNALLRIRIAEQDDAAKCVDYLNKIGYESDFLSFGPGEFDFSIEDERGYISKLSQSDNGLFLVAEVGAEIVGILTFEGGARPRTRHTGELGISIAKSFWGLGIGRMLMEVLIEWAKASEVVRKLNLRVRVDNERAIKLYKDMGFKQEGVITRDIVIEGKSYDCLLMGRTV